MGARKAADAAAHVCSLIEEAIAHQVPEAVAAQAAEATRRWLRTLASPTTVSGGRLRAYYWAVVRRRALSGEPGLGHVRSRCIADTLAADMLAAGHGRERVLEELTRIVGSARAAESVGAAA